MMEYTINPFTTSATYGNFYQFFNGLEHIPAPVETNSLPKTFDKLEKMFSELLYEVESPKNRKELIEYWLTLFTGKKNSVFSKYNETLETTIVTGEYLKYFTTNLFIYLAEDANSTPLEILNYLKNMEDNFSTYIFYPINSFSKITPVNQLKVKIDSILTSIKLEGVTKSMVIQLLCYLLLLDVFETYL